MLLALDIGNSSIKFGVFEGDKLASQFSIATVPDLTVDDLKLAFDNRASPPITAAIASSVVPEIDETVREFCERHFNILPIFVDNTFDFGLTVKYDPPESLGVDRLVAAFAAVEKYGAPVIVCDLGTATTIDAVNSRKEFLGGVIVPGMRTMADSLERRTSKLPKVEIAKPEKVIGGSTISGIQSGIFYGYVDLIEGLIGRISNEIGETGKKVVATGGFVKFIAEECGNLDMVDENLTLDGLRILHNRSEPPA